MKRFDGVRDEELKVLESVCSEFEKSLRQNRKTSIEEAVKSVDEKLREIAFREVLAIEIEFHQDAGTVPSLDSYSNRFPEKAETVAIVYRETVKSRTIAEKGRPNSQPLTEFSDRDVTIASDDVLAISGPADAGTPREEKQEFDADAPTIGAKDVTVSQFGKDMEFSVLPDDSAAPNDWTAIFEDSQTIATCNDSAKSLKPVYDEDKRYRIESEIDRGGMGVVLKVLDIHLQRTLAMKVIRGEEDLETRRKGPSKDKLARFVREATITSRLDHPGVVPVHEMAKDKDGRIFFTMKYVQGKTLGQVYREVRANRRKTAEEKNSSKNRTENKQAKKHAAHQWTQSRILEVLVKVCDTLAFAHSNDVIHRDLKPANIMLGEFGETYVMDWGLAKILNDAGVNTDGNPEQSSALNNGSDTSSGSVEQHGKQVKDRESLRDQSERERLIGNSETVDGSVMGTPHYMPPEQALGRLAELDQQTDIYSIGAMLYEALSGKKPYHEYRTTVDVIQEVCARPPIPIREHTSRAPAELVAIAEKAMQRRKADRYSNAIEMADDLRAFLNNRVVAAYRTGWRAEIEKWFVRNRTIVATALALLVTGLSAIAIIQSYNRSELAKNYSDLEDSQLRLKTSLDNEKALFAKQIGLTKEANDAKDAAETATQKERQTSKRLFAQKLTADSDRIDESGDAVLSTLLAIEALEKLKGDSASESAALRRKARSQLYKTAATLSTRKILKATSAIRGAAFSPDGKTLVTVGSQGYGEIWNFEEGKRLALFFGRPKQELTYVCISPDGKRILASGFQGTFGIWDINDGRNILLTSVGSYIENNNNFQASIHKFEFVDEGKRVIVCTEKAELILLDGFTGEVLNTFEIPENPGLVNAFAFSGDGTRIAAGTRLGQIYLWNVDDRKLIRSIDNAHQNNGGKTTVINSLSFSDDSLLLVSAAIIDSNSEIAKANLWNAETGEFDSTIQLNSSVIHASFRPNHRQILLRTRERLGLWDTESKTILSSIDLDFQSSSVAFDSSGELITVPDSSGVSFFEIAKFPMRGEQIIFLESVSARGKSLLSSAFHPNKRNAITFGSNGIVHAIDLSANRAVKKLARSNPFSRDLEIYSRVNSRENRFFVANSNLTAGMLYSIPEFKLLHTFEFGGEYNRAEFSRSKNELFTGTKTGECRRWNIDSGKQLGQVKIDGPVYSISIDDATQEAFVISVNKTYRWDLKADTIIGEFPFPEKVFHRIPIDASRFLIFDNTRSEIRSFDPLTGADTGRSFREVRYGGLSPDNRLIWCRGNGFNNGGRTSYRKVYILDSETLLPIWTHDDKEFNRTISSAMFSDDGTKFLIRYETHSEAKCYSMRSLDDFSEICQFGNIEDVVAASRDFSRILISESRGSMTLIDGTDGRVVRQLPQTFGYYRRTFFSPDGKYFVSQSHPWLPNPETNLYPSRVSLWRAETGELLAELPGDSDLYVMPFLPNNQAFMTFSETGEIQQWPIDILDSAKKHLPRELNFSERVEFLNASISDTEITENDDANFFDWAFEESQYVNVPDQERREFTWRLLTKMRNTLRKSPSDERLKTAIAIAEKFATGPFDTDPIILDKTAILHEANGDIDRAIQLVEQAKKHPRGKRYNNKLKRLRAIIAPRVASFTSVDWLFSNSAEAESLNAAIQWSLTEEATKKSPQIATYIRARQDFSEGLFGDAANELAGLIRDGYHAPEVYLLKSECHSSQQEFSKSAKSLRLALDHESCRSPELWNRWLAVSFAKENRAPQDLLQQLPPKSKSARAETLYEDHVQWLLKSLSEKETLRINSGWYQDETINGEFWKSDCFFTRGFGYFEHQGRALKFNGPIPDTDKPIVYQSERFILNDYIEEKPGYRIPLPPGEYLIKVGIAEIFSFDRLFDVVVEGEKLFSEYNPVRTPEEREISVQVADGILNIELIGSFRNANPVKISLLSITPK